MKTRLWIGVGFASLLTIVAIVAFSAGERVSDEPVLATYDRESLIDDLFEGETQSIEEVQPDAEFVSAEPENSGGMTEGIKVHGHWTIDVSEPDGKLVSHTEFENALSLPLGPQSLSKFLAQDNTVGFWTIELFSTPAGPQPCQADNSLGDASCVIKQLPSSDPGVANNNLFGDLTVDAPESGTNSGKLVLAGTATAQTETDITRVVTKVRRCDPTVAPVDALTCTGFDRRFTDATLNPVVAVAVDQIVNVTVVISFS